MLRSVTPAQLEKLILEEHPMWDKNSVRKIAESYVSNIDERLEDALAAFIKDGTCAEYEYGEFTLYLIRAMRDNCSYLEAVVLMSEYMKDSAEGKAMILARRRR